MTIKKFFQNLLLVIGGIVFTLFVLEIIIRIFGHQHYYLGNQCPKAMFDKQSVTLLKKNFKGEFGNSEIHGKIKINSKGIRDYERPYTKKNKYRILGLGDSFTFGYGVEFEEEFLTILETMFQQKIGDSVEIIKAGIPSVGPQKYLEVLKKEGVQYAPDYVMVNLFIGNDIEDVQLTGTDSKSSKTKKVTDESFLSSTKTLLRQNLHLYSFIVDRLKSVSSVRKKLQETGIANGLLGSCVVDVLKKEYSPQYELKIKEVFKLLSEINSVSKNRLIVVLIPSREQVYPARLNQAIKQFELQPNEISITKPNEKLMNFCTKNNIACIDLLPSFINHNKEELYYEIDPHFNRNGNKLAAQEIFRQFSPRFHNY